MIQVLQIIELELLHHNLLYRKEKQTDVYP